MTILNMVWDPSQTQVVVGAPAYQAITNPTQLPGGSFDTNFSRCSLFAKSDSYTFTIGLGGTVSELWTHFSLNSDQSSNNATAQIVVSWGLSTFGGGEQIRMVSTSTSTAANVYKFQKSTNGGAAWTDIVTTPTTFSVATKQLNRFDIRIKLHGSAGSIEFYVNEVLRMSYSGALVTQNNSMDYAFFSSDVGIFCTKCYSEIIFADASTLGYRLYSLTPTGAGAQSDFTGTFADIDDIVPDVTDFINSDTVGHITLFALSDLSATYNKYGVVAVSALVNAAITPDSALADLQIALRTSATNYFTSNLGVTKNSQTYVKKVILELNPVTSVPWSYTEINALQLGVKAV